MVGVGPIYGNNKETKHLSVVTGELHLLLITIKSRNQFVTLLLL